MCVCYVPDTYLKRKKKARRRGGHLCAVEMNFLQIRLNIVSIVWERLLLRVLDFAIWDTGATQKKPSPSSSMLRLVHVFFEVCCCVGVPVIDVGVCVCGAACYASCAVLQRRHNFDAFLKRLGIRQPKVLIRHSDASQLIR